MTGRRVAAVLVGGLLLAACGGNDNHDPRQGRVETSQENCFTGGCYTDWKVCIGPDLLVHVSGDDHTVKDSFECAP